MTSLFFRKEFHTTPAGMILMNTEPVGEYCNGILDSLWETKDDVLGQRSVKLSFLSDFASVFEYDLTYAVIPEPEGSFDTAKEKRSLQRRRLLVQDFYLYIGKTFLLYHEALFRNNCFPTLYSPHLSVNFQEVYEAALADYHKVVTGLMVPDEIPEQKKCLTIDPSGNGIKITKPISNTNNNHAIAATYILPTLIERELVIKLKNSVLEKWLDGLEGTELDPDEKRIHDWFEAVKPTNQVLFVGSKESMEKRIWEIGRKYDVLPENKSMQDIFCNDRILLNQLLDSKYTEAMVRTEYLTLLRLLFKKENLNIRNNIEHGNSTTYDYLDITFVATFMQLLIDIAAGDVVKEGLYNQLV